MFQCCIVSIARLNFISLAVCYSFSCTMLRISLVLSSAPSEVHLHWFQSVGTGHVGILCLSHCYVMLCRLFCTYHSTSFVHAIFSCLQLCLIIFGVISNINSVDWNITALSVFIQYSHLQKSCNSQLMQVYNFIGVLSENFHLQLK